MEYLNGLNEPQKMAVLHTEGPLLIVAGAGAGKTKTVTHRIAHLIAKGVPGRSILAVTFTNKAAQEMRERVMRLLPADSHGAPFVSTFHTLGVRLLREFHVEAGVPKHFTIWDRDDSVRAVKAALKEMDVERYTPRQILGVVSKAKGAGSSVRDYTERASLPIEHTAAQVWEKYERALREEGALDFDDLLVRTRALLRDDERVRSLLQNRWTHITVDEYQDTNMIQYEIARFLSGEHMNICVVGDVDQCLYSWRGAEIGNLLLFEKNFPGTKVVVLEENYRSTRTILAAANAVIEKNVRRVPKNLFTNGETGDPIGQYAAFSESDEAFFVAEQAERLIKAGTNPSEIAVLYRQNFQSRAIEEAFLRRRVPYRVLGTRFFERAEVKDILSYLRAAMNPESKADLSRIVSTPPRGLGKTTLEKMLAKREGELNAGARQKVQNFRDLLAKIRHAATTLPLSETMRVIMEESGLESHHTDGTEEGRERVGNMRELVNLAARWDDEAPEEAVERLLEEAALQSEQDTLDQSIGAVSLMTVHASKGLEFDVVFVTGLEQGLFPSEGFGGSSDGPREERDEEEERRLFYVALTRARKKVLLSCASERMRFGSRERAFPSEFLTDIDERLIENLSPHRGSASAPKRGLLDDWDDVIR